MRLLPALFLGALASLSGCSDNRPAGVSGGTRGTGHLSPDKDESNVRALMVTAFTRSEGGSDPTAAEIRAILKICRMEPQQCKATEADVRQLFRLGKEQSLLERKESSPENTARIAEIEASASEILRKIGVYEAN